MVNIFACLSLACLASNTSNPTLLDSVKSWLVHPYTLSLDSQVWAQRYAAHKQTLAFATQERLDDSLIIYLRPEIQTMSDSARKAIVLHEVFHYVPLHPIAKSMNEGLANWFVYRMGFNPMDPLSSIEKGFATGWFSVINSVLYPWWRVLARLPDTTVILWMRHGRQIPKDTLVLALQETAKCFAGQIHYCLEGEPIVSVSPAPLPQRPASLSLHFLESKKCPLDLAKNHSCYPAEGSAKHAVLVVGSTH